MGLRQLELTVLSAEGLKNVNKCFTTMNPYAVAWIDSNVRAPTQVAERGGKNPSWNCVIKMVCRESLFGTLAKAKLTIEVYDYKSSIEHMKLVGTAIIPLAELRSNMNVAKSGGLSEPKRMSLDIRTRKGKLHGNLKLEVKLGEAVNQADPPSESVPILTASFDNSTCNASPINTYEAPGYKSDRDHHAARRPPAPIHLAQYGSGQAAPVYYQHTYVEPLKPYVGPFNRAPFAQSMPLALLLM